MDNALPFYFSFRNLSAFDLLKAASYCCSQTHKNNKKDTWSFSNMAFYSHDPLFSINQPLFVGGASATRA